MVLLLHETYPGTRRCMAAGPRGVGEPPDGALDVEVAQAASNAVEHLAGHGCVRHCCRADRAYAPSTQLRSNVGARCAGDGRRMGAPRGGSPQGCGGSGRIRPGSGSCLDPAPRVHPRRAPEGRERARVDDDADLRRLHRPSLRVGRWLLRRLLSRWFHPCGFRRNGCVGADAHARDQRSPRGFAGVLPRLVPRGLARGSPARARHRCDPPGLTRRHERIPAPARRVFRGLEHLNDPRRAAGRGPAGGDLVRKRPRR